MSKTYFLSKAMIVICCLMLASCATKYKDLKWSFYPESVNSFLVTEDESKLVLIGKEHHYIFDLYNDTRNMLFSKKRDQLSIQIGNVIVLPSGKVQLEYTLWSPDKNQSWLKGLGFHRVKGATSSFYRYWGELNGMVYVAKEKIPAQYKLRKNHDFTVRVKSYSSAETVLSDTPVKIAVGMPLAIAGIAALYPFYIKSKISSEK